jgi:glycine/D-amino acid oxidase-like deaminating enzyme
LKRAGVEAIVVEREFCGFGASGRNAGHLTPTIGKDLPTLLMLYGEERTAAIVRFADHCVRRTESLVAEHGIDWDYAPTGNVMAVVHPKQEKRLRRAASTAPLPAVRVHQISHNRDNDDQYSIEELTGSHGFVRVVFAIAFRFRRRMRHQRPSRTHPAA